MFDFGGSNKAYNQSSKPQCLDFGIVFQKIELRTGGNNKFLTPPNQTTSKTETFHAADFTNDTVCLTFNFKHMKDNIYYSFK